MTTNIDVHNKPAMPEMMKPAMADQKSKDIKAKQETLKAVDSTTKAEKKDSDKGLEKSLDSAIKQLNSYVQSVNRNIEFNIDKDNGRTVVKVIDTDTEELIRQIPNEEALHIAKRLDTQLNENNIESSIFLIKERA